MIDPGIEMVDLEPDGFGVISEIAGAFFARPRAELHVLHRDGRIVRAVHTIEGLVPSLRGQRIDASEATAEALRAEADVARAILVDEASFGDLAEALTRASEAPTQDQMILRSRRTFLESPSVIAVPPVRGGERERWSAHLKALGREYLALIVGTERGARVFTVLATIRDGLVRRVTSPSLRADATDVVEAARALGDLRLAVVADLGVYADAIARRSIDPLRARATVCFGLPE